MARAIRYIPTTSTTNFVLTYTNVTAGTVTAQYNLLAAGLPGTDGALNGVTVRYAELVDPVVYDGSNATSQNVTAGPYIAPENSILSFSDGGNAYAAVAANASDVVVKASAGRMCKVMVTVTGANPMLIYDNATAGSGTVIAALPASPTVGTIYNFQVPCLNGITIKGSATNPGVLVSYN